MPECRRRCFYLRGWVRLLPDWLQKLIRLVWGLDSVTTVSRAPPQRGPRTAMGMPGRGNRRRGARWPMGGTRGRGHRGRGARWARAGAACIAGLACDGHARVRHRGAGVRWACAGAAIADSVHDECVPARRRAPDRDIADIHITKCITPPAQSAGTVHARYSTRITLTSLSGKGIRPT